MLPQRNNAACRVLRHLGARRVIPLAAASPSMTETALSCDGAIMRGCRNPRAIPESS